MQIDVDNTALKGFNAQAQQELARSAGAFVEDLIKESNRIESSRHQASGDPQITSSMVSDATVLIRRGLVQPKKRWGAIVVRILAAVFPLIAGFLYDPVKLQQPTYMLIFVLVVTASIITVTISTILE